MTASGSVVDRITGNPMSGSRIEFSGAAIRSADVVAGEFKVEGLKPGNYEVTIIGASHVEHKTHQLTISESVTLSFSVIAWGASKFGATYDAKFHEWFGLIARNGWAPFPSHTMYKWLSPPAGIYVTEGLLTSRGWAKFVPLLLSVNRDEVPKMFGGIAGPLPIQSGPALPNDSREEWIVVTFYNGGGNASPTYRASWREPWPTQEIVGGTVRLPQRYYDTDEVERELCCDPARYVLSHELFHIAYAGHEDSYLRFNCATRPRSEVCAGPMSGTASGGRLSANDVLASWLVYHPQTVLGNRAPDQNPRYVLRRQ